MQLTDETWSLSDDDFRSFIYSLRPGHKWVDRPVADPAMQALEVERQLRRAGRKLEALDKLFPNSDRPARAAQQLRFVADRLAMGEGVDTEDALIWLDAGRKFIRECIEELAE